MTECSRQHISPTTSKTTWLQDHTNQRRVGALPWCHPGHHSTSVGPRQYPRYTHARKGRPWVAPMHHNRRQTANKTHTPTRRRSTFVNHVHGSGACSLRPHISEATTEPDDKIRLRVFPRSRHVQEPTGSPTGSPAGNPERDSARELREAPRQHVQSGHLHQKRISGRWTWWISLSRSWSWVTARSLMVSFTIEELDLPKNTKSTKKFKITIDESADEVEKAKTTINNFEMYYHDEVTHPDEVHEECFVQLLPCW